MQDNVLDWVDEEVGGGVTDGCQGEERRAKADLELELVGYEGGKVVVC